MCSINLFGWVAQSKLLLKNIFDQINSVLVRKLKITEQYSSKMSIRNAYFLHSTVFVVFVALLVV